MRNLIDGSGNLIDTIAYDAYGNVTSESSPSSGDRYKYTAREFDSETGLQYNRARYYDPATGRWISEDPIGFAGGDANLYRYVTNSPTSHTDPYGLRQNTILPPMPEYERRCKMDAEDKARKRIRGLIDKAKIPDKHKALITRYLMAVFSAAQFHWDHCTGFFGKCDDWLDKFMNRYNEVRAGFTHEELQIIDQHVEIVRVGWTNDLTPNWLHAGHVAARICIKDAGCLYLDDGSRGGLSHLFGDDDIPSYYTPLAQNKPPHFQRPPNVVQEDAQLAEFLFWLFMMWFGENADDMLWLFFGGK